MAAKFDFFIKIFLFDLSGSRTTVWEVKRTDLVDILQRSNATKLDNQFIYLQDFVVKQTHCPDTQLSTLKGKVAYFKNEYKSKWLKASRNKEHFNLKNKNWLKNTIKFDIYENPTPMIRGRPKTSFKESSDRTKRRRTASLRRDVEVHQLAYATQMSLRSSGEAAAASVVKDVTFTTPKRASKYKKAYLDSKKKQVHQQLSADEALSMIVDAKLTRHQYNIVRSKDKGKFPCYSYIQNAKKNCYPDQDSIQVTSTSAQVNLQALLDHTTARLLEVQKEVINTMDAETIGNLKLISKWGIDGSAANEYKQKFDSQEDSDAAILMTSFVPIQLVNENKNIVVWQNPRTSSTRYCRPIRFCFQRETADVTVEEKNRVQEEIRTLHPTSVEVKGQDRQCVVHHTLLFTMIDGKVCNAITETSSTQRCYVCSLTSKDFNNLEKVMSTPVDETKLEFGLSILHGWIRFMECLIHVSYKLPLKKWQARRPEEKNIIAEKKKLIQEKFKTELGLLIDQPKQSFGNSNDGNTARRFFENAHISSSITDIDEEIIIRFHRILQTIASGYEIDVDKFKMYCLETARKYVAKYEWYPMSTTVHKILVHGPIIISKALLPIGQLSEEAQEARNKDFRAYRRSYSRKTSRKSSNEDIFNNLLISSDPYITSFRQLPKKRISKFPREVIEMLKPCNYKQDGDLTESDSSVDSDNNYSDSN